MAFQFQVEIMERCQVSPPTNSVPTTSLPLSFFDIPWFLCRPMKRIFLYDFKCSTAQFSKEILPQLKQSLSLALQFFFPLCGRLVSPPHPATPYISYNDGDSVTLTIAESNSVFSDLLRAGPRDVKETRPLVPPLPPSRVSEDQALVEITSLSALQVTHFPNSGICVGIHIAHVVADGKACIHFLKFWASLFKSQYCDMSCIREALPIVDRGVVKDHSNGIKDVLLRQWREWGSPCWKEDPAASALLDDMVRSTFVLTYDDVKNLKKFVSGKFTNAKQCFSSFVVTCALTWVCVIRSQDQVTEDLYDDEDLCHFSFVADCRNRNEIAVSSTYFGNCLAICFVTIKRGLLRGEDGIALAAEAIRCRVQDLENGVLVGAENWLLKWEEVSKTGDLLTVAGSPRLDVYDTDFGWGRPALVEMVQIDASGAMSLAEARNEEGGLEVGLARSRAQMDAFSAMFRQNKEQLK